MQPLLVFISKYRITASTTVAMLVVVSTLLFWRHPDTSTRIQLIFKAPAVCADYPENTLSVRTYIFGSPTSPGPFVDRPCFDSAGMVVRHAILNAVTWLITPVAGVFACFLGVGALSSVKRAIARPRLSAPSSQSSALLLPAAIADELASRSAQLEEAANKKLRQGSLCFFGFCLLHLVAVCGFSLEALGPAFVFFAQSAVFGSALTEWESRGLALSLCLLALACIVAAVVAASKAEELSSSLNAEKL